MSGKGTVRVSQKTLSPHAAASATARAGVNKSDASARWAALDSRHERLVTASDAVLADGDRKDDHRIAS
jgi:hypothetical protein